MKTTSAITVKPYRRPSATVLLYGDVTPSVVEKLRSILRVHGSRGLRIILASHSSPRALEALRDFLHENYTFTLEVYTSSSSLLEKLENINALGEVVAVIVSNSELTKQVPSSLLDKVVVA